MTRTRTKKNVINPYTSIPSSVSKPSQAFTAQTPKAEVSDIETQLHRANHLGHNFGEAVFSPTAIAQPTQPQAEMEQQAPTQMKADAATARAQQLPPSKDTPINSDPKLEKEADILGAKATQGEQVQVASVGSGLQRKATSRLGHNFERAQFQNHRSVSQASEVVQCTKLDEEKKIKANDKFLEKRKQERQNGLNELAAGKLTGGRTVESDALPANFIGSRNLKPTSTSDTSQSGPSVTSGTTNTTKKPHTNTFSFDKKKKEGNPNETITAKTKVLSGGKNSTLEHKLNNPISTTDRPRSGIADRQKHILRVAGSADPFMRQLEGGGDLSASHKPKPDFLDKKSKLKPGYNWNTSNTLQDAHSSNPIHTYGAEEYGNRETRANKPWAKDSMGNPIPGAAVERLLPELNPPHASITQPGTHSRQNQWSEADVNPVTHKGTPTPGGKVKLENRGSDRLLHTAESSTVKGTSEQVGAADSHHSRYYVTADHYESAVPITPVDNNYSSKAKNYDSKTKTYNSPYMDPSGKLNSLDYHDQQQHQQEQEKKKKRRDTI